MSLSLTDNEHFLGYCLSLGHQIYLTIDPDLCSVNLRKWYRPNFKKDDPEADLLPSREGIRLSYEQFKRFVEFLESQMISEFPHSRTTCFAVIDLNMWRPYAACVMHRDFYLCSVSSNDC